MALTPPTVTASQPRGLRSALGRRPALALFIAIFLVYVAFLDLGSGNLGYRYLDQTLALVHDGTWAIDRYNNTADVAIVQGHRYPSVPPGMAVLGVPSYALSQMLWGLVPPLERVRLSTFIHDYLVQDGRFEADNSFVQSVDLADFFVGALVVTIFLNAAAGALLAVLVYRTLQLVGLEEDRARWLTILFAFGTFAFFYSTTLNAHIPSTLAAFAAFYLLLQGTAGRTWWAALVSGACAAAAMALDYPLGVTLAATTVYFVWRVRSWRLRAAYGFGAGLVLVGMAAYSWVIFGSVIGMPFTHVSAPLAANHARGLFGVGTPSLHVVLELLVLPRRGLLVYAPLIILSCLGGVVAWRQRRHRPEVLFIAGLVLGMLLFNAGYTAWHGDWAFGPRHLVVVLPFLTILAGLGRWPARWLLWTVGSLGILVNWLGAQFRTVGPEFVNPLGSVYGPAFLSQGPTFPLVANIAKSLDFASGSLPLFSGLVLLGLVLLVGDLVGLPQKPTTRTRNSTAALAQPKG